MRCPKCHREMEEKFPSKDILIRIGGTLLQMFNPVNMVKTALFDLKNKYNLMNTSKEVYCCNCRLFAIQCPHCNRIGHIQDSIPSEGKRKCIKCYKDFYYSVSED